MRRRATTLPSLTRPTASDVQTIIVRMSSTDFTSVLANIFIARICIQSDIPNIAQKLRQRPYKQFATGTISGVWVVGLRRHTRCWKTLFFPHLHQQCWIVRDSGSKPVSKWHDNSLRIAELCPFREVIQTLFLWLSFFSASVPAL